MRDYAPGQSLAQSAAHFTRLDVVLCAYMLKGNHHFAIFWPQVLMGLVGSSLNMLGLVPVSHGLYIVVQGPKPRSLPQVLVGLFGSSLNMLGLVPASHGLY